MDQSTINRERNALILSHVNVIDVRQVIFNPSKKYGIVVMEAWSPLTLQAVNEEAIHISIEDSIRYHYFVYKLTDPSCCRIKN